MGAVGPAKPAPDNPLKQDRFKLAAGKVIPAEPFGGALTDGCSWIGGGGNLR
jgi:hypothetical protein